MPSPCSAMATSSNASMNMGAERRRVRVPVVGGDLAILPANICVIPISIAIVAGWLLNVNGMDGEQANWMGDEVWKRSVLALSAGSYNYLNAGALLWPIEFNFRGKRNPSRDHDSDCARQDSSYKVWAAVQHRM
ncbi:hypothetical protein GB937_001587 [Aspergillus fischeri]|nr:hypothetical protein GB937_001587 [Aspergillus fischeri]